MNSKAVISTRISGLVVGMGLVATLVAGCAGGSLTTREKGAGIGALGGAAAGGIIGPQCDILAPGRPSAVS